MQSARASEIASICYIISVRITEGSAHPNIHRYPQYTPTAGVYIESHFFPQLRSGQQQIYTSLQNCLWNVWGDVPKLQLDIGPDPMSMSFYHAWFPRSRFHFSRKLCPSSQDGIKLAKLLCWQGTIRRTLWQSTLATIDSLSPSTVDFPFATTCCSTKFDPGSSGKWTICWQSFIAKGYLDSWMRCGTASPGFTSHCQDHLSGMKRQILKNAPQTKPRIRKKMMNKYYG